MLNVGLANKLASPADPSAQAAHSVCNLVSGLGQRYLGSRPCFSASGRRRFCESGSALGEPGWVGRTPIIRHSPAQSQTSVRRSCQAYGRVSWNRCERACDMGFLLRLVPKRALVPQLTAPEGLTAGMTKCRAGKDGDISGAVRVPLPGSSRST